MDVVAYVDGLNLYYGLKSKYGRDFHWLDLVALVSKMRTEDNIIKVRYFTSIARNDPEAARRQETYLAALSAHRPEIEIVPGRFKKKTTRCGACRMRWTCECTPPRTYETYEEKLTDVALGVAMVHDAASGYGDLSLLVSADTDFHPAVAGVLELDPTREVMIACPPGRLPSKRAFARPVTAFSIKKRHLRESLLPERVWGADGELHERPLRWYPQPPVPA